MNNIKKLKHTALHYFHTLVSVSRESFLILDSEFRVILANDVFYKNFQVKSSQTVGKLIFDLGNGQWNIPELKKLLSEILPSKKVVKNYEVKHTFQSIGGKTILLNARQIDNMQLIVIAMEDITDREKLRTKLAKHTQRLEVEISKRTIELNRRIKELESLNKVMVGRELKMVELKKEIEKLRKK